MSELLQHTTRLLQRSLRVPRRSEHVGMHCAYCPHDACHIPGGYTCGTFVQLDIRLNLKRVGTAFIVFRGMFGRPVLASHVLCASLAPGRVCGTGGVSSCCHLRLYMMFVCVFAWGPGQWGVGAARAVPQVLGH